jgi:hypothetical protein
MFRTQGGDFSFPYPISGRDQDRAKKYARDMFFNNKWPLQKRPLSWLVEKFWPVKGWTDEDLANLKANTFAFSDNVKNSTKSEEIEPTNNESVQDNTSALTKGIIYYSDSQLPDRIAVPVRDNLQKISDQMHIPIVSATLKKLKFGVKSIYFPSLKRGYPAMFKQIMSALEHSESDIIFFCEHDVLYSPTHFEFTPPDRNTFYYNQNVWYLRLSDGHALHYDVNQLSGLCGYRDELYTHFKERYERVMTEGFSRKMGFEPMTHHRIAWKRLYNLGTWKSRVPNIDIRHEGNLTATRWFKSQFRNQKLLKGWKKSKTKIYGWGKTADLVLKFK